MLYIYYKLTPIKHHFLLPFAILRINVATYHFLVFAQHFSLFQVLFFYNIVRATNNVFCIEQRINFNPCGAICANTNSLFCNHAKSIIMSVLTCVLQTKCNLIVQFFFFVVYLIQLTL